jgi:tight adherence protein B
MDGLTLVSLVVAVCAALLTWLAFDLAGNTLNLYRAHVAEKTAFQAQEFFLFIDPKKLLVANLAFMVLGGVVTWLATGSTALALVVLASLALTPRVVYSFLRRQRLSRFEDQLPDALMMLSGGMRAGVGLSSAIAQLVREAPVPLSQEFNLMLREQRLGVPLEQALTNLNRRVPTQSTTLVVSAMRIASETGGGLAETLERSAQTLRSRQQMEGKIGALTAQGKLQAWVVGLLPIVLMLVLNKMEPEAMGMLWDTRLGWGVLGLIAFLEVMGIYVISKIVTIDV